MTKTNESLAAALEREHGAIDSSLEQFSAEPSSSSSAEVLAGAAAALRRHIYLEEEFVFPALAAAGLVAPIFVMLREHGQIWETLDALQREADAGTETPDTLNRCHQLLVQLAHHNMKEERIVYPEAERVLPPPAAARLTAFLESGRLPDGWVCAKAGP